MSKADYQDIIRAIQIQVQEIREAGTIFSPFAWNADHGGRPVDAGPCRAPSHGTGPGLGFL